MELDAPRFKLTQAATDLAKLEGDALSLNAKIDPSAFKERYAEEIAESGLNTAKALYLSMSHCKGTTRDIPTLLQP